MKKIHFSALLLTLCFLINTPASADYTYTYQGKEFSLFGSPSIGGNSLIPATDGNQLTISFSTKSLLSPNQLSEWDNTVSEFYNLSISDGITTVFTQENNSEVVNFGVYGLSINEYGLPINFYLVAQLDYDLNLTYASRLTANVYNNPTFVNYPYTNDYTENYSSNPNNNSTAYQQYNSNSAGVWSVIESAPSNEQNRYFYTNSYGRWISADRWTLSEPRITNIPEVSEPESYAMIIIGLSVLGLKSRTARKNVNSRC